MTTAWILQGLLAATFLGAGSMKLVMTRDKLLAKGALMAWAEDFNARSLRAIGAVEVLGAIGLVIPTLTGIQPVLTPIAAGSLLLTMIGASATHLRRREFLSLVPTAMLSAMAIAVIVLLV